MAGRRLRSQGQAFAAAGNCLLILWESQRTEIVLERTSDTVQFSVARTAQQIIKERLEGMPTAPVDSYEALQYLAQRSIVFRQIGPNIGQFAHRTFQEYLAGREYALGAGLDRLLGHVNEPDWRKVVVFAAAVASVPSASAIIGQILNASSHTSEAYRSQSDACRRVY